jgi:methylenetetrahydrofolate reductase (NADPH)
MENRLRAALAQGRFAVTVEIVPPPRDGDVAAALGARLELVHTAARDERIAAFSVADRVLSDDDHDPIAVALVVARAGGTTPLVHLSGKDRGWVQLAWSLGRLAEAGLDNILCVTGDRLKTMPRDRRVSFADSVQALAIARRLFPRALLAAGVSPFKYTEEEAHNQYLKMMRKHAAGADVVVTQVGWDPRKLDELISYRRRHGLTSPAMVNLMPLPVGTARRLHKGLVPGVVVTDDLLTLAEFEAQAPDKGRAARLDRLALQIVGAERLGYAGAQLSGLGRYEDVVHVLGAADEWRERARTITEWWTAWNESIRLPTGAAARLHAEPAYFIGDETMPGDAASRVRPSQRLRYHALRAAHQVLFHGRSPVVHAVRPLARRIAPASRLAGWLTAFERRIKQPLVGCEACGVCRLPETFYVCPETCPKGLANGPCGGSTNNMCEAGDRECVHALIYRLACLTGQRTRLEQNVVASAPEPRGGSSWLRHFAARPATSRRIAP